MQKSYHKQFLVGSGTMKPDCVYTQKSYHKQRVNLLPTYLVNCVYTQKSYHKQPSLKQIPKMSIVFTRKKAITNSRLWA